MKIDNIVQTAMMVYLAMMSTPSLATSTQTPPKEMEKCYGVVKAGFNDCATAKASCAGSATKDKQTDAFVFVPKGLCAKLADGHLKP